MIRRTMTLIGGRVRRTPGDSWLTLALVATAVVFVFVQLQPELILADTTPTGGDMGAHVWGPAYLRDHLLSQGRLTGWAPDWYAGFPAFHFYMVVPSLLIVALDVVLPYGVAFKLIAVSGVLTLPVAAWALGRLARMPFPTPALLALGTLPFLFSPLFTIYGGNIASTLAGEFAFSISLSLALVFLGLVLRGLDTGRHGVWAAAVLALCVLCHVIPAIFAVVGATVALALRGDRARLAWLAGIGMVGGLLTSFWTVPFLLQRAHMNDMGWTKITTYWESLFPGRLGIWLTQTFGGQGTAEVTDDLTLVIVLALAGLGFSVAYRRHLGTFLGVLAGVVGLIFVVAPEGRLWNARLLPFWYLCLYLLAAVALAEVALSVAALVGGRREALGRATLRWATALGALAVVVGVGLPLRSLPFGQESPAGEYSWAGFSTTDRSFIPGWAEWNFAGLERKDAYPEYRDLMGTMDDLGQSQGCGRAMWEFESELNRYGSTMALMLLPYWTDGCIDSMEGLFFESSMTTPFHFLNQSELSSKPSRPQRDLPYADLDVSQGVDHLQLLGVRYYLAFSAEAVSQAEVEPDLAPVASSGPWRVFEVTGSSLVEPLDAEPVVVEGAGAGGKEWLEPVVEWYNDPSARDVLIAADGPASWARVGPGEDPPHRPVTAAQVSGIETTNLSISFTVDRPDAPVLVKTSYFPNWTAQGAEGPFQVAPNLMAVVPTGTEVTLRYEDTAVDRTGQDMTMLGAIGLVLLARGGLAKLPPYRKREEEEDGADDAGNGGVATEESEPDGDIARGPRSLTPLLRRARASATFRRARIFALPMALVTFVGVICLINHFSGHDWGDDFALYMRQAKGLAIGNIGEVISDNRFSVDNSGWHTFSPYSYPWGWPLIIAPLYALFGLNYEVVKLVEVVAFCLFLLTFFTMVWRRAGPVAATLLSLLIGLSPIYIGGTGTALSDIPYLCFVGLSLWWMDRCRMSGLVGGVSRNQLVIMGLLLAYTYNVRREGVTLLLAFAALHLVVLFGPAVRTRSLEVLRRADWRMVSVPYATFGLAIVGFHLLLPTVLLPSAPGTGLQNIPDRVTFYTDILAQQIGLQDPGSPIQLLGSEAAARLGLLCLVVLAGAGVILRLRHRLEEDIALATFLGCATLLVLVSPYQEGRYLYTITPFLVYFAYQALPTLLASMSAPGRSLVRAAAIAPAVAVFGLVTLNASDTARATDYHLDYAFIAHGPETPDAQEMFAAVQDLTRADDVILFFRARAMTLYTDRRSVMGANLEELLPRSDWYVMAKDSTYSQKLLTDDDAAAYGLTKVWENEGWVIWRVPPRSS